MNDPSNLVKAVVIRFISAYLGCLLIGYIFFQDVIFIPQSSAFQFIFGGALGAIFLAFLQSVLLRSSCGIYIVLGILSMSFTNPHLDSVSIVRDVLMLAALGYGVFLFWKNSLSDEKTVWFRPLQLAGFLAVTNMAATYILLLYGNPGEMYVQALFYSLSLSFMIGLGLGIGTEAGNLYLKHLVAKKTTELESE
jgi:hypothetical protein